MKRTRFILDIAFDISVGIVMIGIVVGAIMVSITPAGPQTLSTSTTAPSVAQAVPQEGAQMVTLVPKNPNTAYATATIRSIPDNSSEANIAAVPSVLPTYSATILPAAPTQADLKAADYIYVLAVATAVVAVFNLVNYIFGLVYRIGITTLKPIR